MKTNVLKPFAECSDVSTTTTAALNAAISAFIANQDIRHNTPATYKRALKQFFNWVEESGRQVADLARKDVLSFKRALEAADYSPNTINSYLTALRRFYTFLSLQGYKNITEGIKSERTASTDRFEKSDFTSEQAAAIVEAVRADGSRRDVAIIETMIRCGLRTIEVVRATVGDIQEVGGGYILRVVGKGDKIRFVPLTAKTYAAINDYLRRDRRNARPNEPLFISEAHQCKGAALTTASVSRLAKKYIRAIGIDDSRHTAHSMRHTTAALIYESTHDLDRIQQLLGHSNPATTQIYAKQAMQRDYFAHSPNTCIDNLF